MNKEARGTRYARNFGTIIGLLILALLGWIIVGLLVLLGMNVWEMIV